MLQSHVSGITTVQRRYTVRAAGMSSTTCACTMRVSLPAMDIVTATCSKMNTCSTAPAPDNVHGMASNQEAFLQKQDYSLSPFLQVSFVLLTCEHCAQESI